jgi:hypothetical protein
MKVPEVDFWGRDCGDGVDGSVKRPVLRVEWTTGLPELASVEVSGHSASLNCHSA